jgi:phosphoenolpyruvate carboxykinase (GTP)
MPPESFKHKGYKIWTVGDDIAWLHIGKEGELRAINPEYGFFGVLPGTNSETNPQALATMKEGAIYTNVLLKEDKTVWWEDGEGEVPSKGIDWKGLEWTPEKETAGAHPNSRFTAPLTQSPTVSSAIDNPEGVPISAILFGGRRATINPLVYETYSWTHGVYAGATMCSERTAAQEVSTTADDIRHDPMAMQPFCGYNMGDYFKHWIYMGRQLKKKPKIYYVNWFRKGDAGDFLWPGYGDNLRVLEWILNRCRDKSFAQETPIGYVPRSEDLDLSGLSLSSESMEKLFTVNKDRWLEDLRQQESFLMSFGADLPEEIWQEFRSLSKRVKS